MNGDDPTLLIEPVVSRPHEAEAGCAYLVTVDLRGPLGPRGEEDPDAWPYQDEELTFTVALDGGRHFVCEVLDDPALVLHRYGGTYGPARFVVTAGRATGPAELWLTLTNQWGTPVRKAALPCRITPQAEGAPDDTGATAVLGYVPAQPPEDPEPRGWPESDPADAEGLAPFEGPPVPRTTPGPVDHVTISFAGFNRAWAEWIGDRLERRGVTVVQQRWDPPAEVPLEESLRDLTLARGQVLAVLSDWYFQPAPRGHEEWNRALREVVAAAPDRFAAVCVTTSALPGAASVFGAADLTNVGAEEAERRLLARLGLPTDPLPEAAGPRKGPRYPADVPQVWGGVPRRNTRFTGRDELLAATYEALNEARPGAGVVALHGMSGVGKTQLAAEYVYRFGSEYDVVWWVSAERRSFYRQRLAELAPELGLSTGAEYGERLRAVRDALRRGEPFSHWLLVLDGADEPEHIWDLVPTGPGHVLITSRNPEWSEHNSDLVEVPVYERDESVAFIRRRAPRLTPHDSGRLAEALEDLPLLLDQTAGWLNDSEMSVEEYIGLLEGGIGQDVVKVSVDFPLTFRTAWSLLLNKLWETAPEAAGLLRLCSFFAPDSIPLRLLHEVAWDTVAGLEALTDPDRLDRAVQQLLRYSVVRLETTVPSGRGPVDPSRALHMHRMIHRMMRDELPPADHAACAEAARGALAAVDRGQPSDVRMWTTYAALTPHLKWAEVLESTAPAVQDLVLDCLRYLYLSGEYGSGVRLAEPAMTSWTALLGATHPRIWDLGHHYANLLRALGDYRTSERVERAAADYLAAEHGDHDLEHLRAAGGLAADLRGLGRYDEALRLSVSIRDRYLAVLGPQDYRTLNADNNLAVSLRLLGRYGEAFERDRHTLDLRRSVLGEQAPATLYSELNCAIDLRLLGHHRDAEGALERTVRRHLAALGANNPQTLRAQHNLALCRYLAGDPAAARPALARVRRDCQRLLGEHHPLTLLITASAACAERRAGDPDRALLLHERVVAGYRSMLGDAHPYTIGAVGNLGLMRWALGERDAAVDAIEQARSMMVRSTDAGHPWALGCAYNAMLVRMRTGRTGEARGLGRANGPRTTALLGADHPLASAYRQAEDPARAEHLDFWDFEPLIV
ncbi:MULTISPECIES: FxSxx-COOH system tetratricopeptide repeat protein [unclassified Streptomyces]|uniref:FxSxx-COOH system tetratricopeptide repeat protein n=2 Tax=Streptomyces TaxID=1883 RepID=UPI00081B2A8B|nr:FxSxx-COOH system tetratricopeptide repeat protein [Streptomyces sp. DvalAA-43]MYQ88641.1 tetratricopeptide repeat protein [Streptomyces sp. SID4936]SCE56218.1 Tetratricopeptide (TPR) repeat [Streptomyces sp. DvalAA-43]